MAVRTPALALVALLLTGACAGSSVEAPPPVEREALADPPAARGGPSPWAPAASGAAEVAEEIVLTIPVGSRPDGTELDIAVRSVRVGDRREVVLETPDGVVDHHVIDGDRHWWWIPPSARRISGGVEWIHLDVTEVAEVGDLPDLVADARVPLPRPGEVVVGAPVAGHQVVAVRHVDGDEDHLELHGLDEPAVLRRRPLPPGTEIDLPVGATELADLPEALGW